jgi:FkbM family methyltransferase
MGIRVRHIESGNDGDVCNSCVTYELLRHGNPVNCFDIGVDEGWWSFFACDANPNVTIHAFEPNPKSFKALLPYLGNTPQITLHNIALSDKDGTLKFCCQGGESHSRAKYAENAIVVQCARIDHYIEDKTIDLIKIDTEGHDITILKTLHPHMDRIKSIIFEYTVYWYGSTQEECIHRSIEELTYLHTRYSYMYIMSRRDHPYLMSMQTLEDITQFVNDCYTNHHQTDILVTNVPINSIPVFPFCEN